MSAAADQMIRAMMWRHISGCLTVVVAILLAVVLFR